MIATKITNEGSLYVDTWCVPPTVYLDHWAWRKISESKPLSDRFVNALKLRTGTLVLSWLNILEFTKLTDEQQASKADELLDRILPDIFLIDPNFFKVISREQQAFAGASGVAPHADLATLKFFSSHNFSKPNSLKLFPAQNLFQLAIAAKIAGRHDSFADLVIGHIESMRRDFDGSAEFRKNVTRLPKGQPNEFGTRNIAGELLGSFFVNKSVKIDRNHAIDVSHAIVSVAYCDYVLLDAHWSTQVEQARKRIEEAKLSFPMAKVFSERNRGIERFLEELESGGGRAATIKV